MWKAELQKKQYKPTFMLQVYLSTIISTSRSVLSNKEML